MHCRAFLCPPKNLERREAESPGTTLGQQSPQENPGSPLNQMDCRSIFTKITGALTSAFPQFKLKTLAIRFQATSATTRQVKGHRPKRKQTAADANLSAKYAASTGLDSSTYGTHSLRRTKATLIYRRTKNLRAVQLLLGHTNLDSTVRYLGIELDDALEIAENTEI